MLAERLMDCRALTELSIAQPRNSQLVSNEDRERPTEPHNLKPSDSHALSVSIPRLRPLPSELVNAIRALPPPNPESYVEMSIALVLRGLENQRDMDVMLDGAVDRINADAEARRARATADINRNFEFTNHEVQKLAGKVGELETSVRELVPRMGKVETRLEDGDERFEQIALDMAVMRTQLDRLDRELAILKGIKDATAGTAATKTE
jgi:hypothetical protein